MKFSIDNLLIRDTDALVEILEKPGDTEVYQGKESKSGKVTQYSYIVGDVRYDKKYLTQEFSGVAVATKESGYFKVVPRSLLYAELIGDMKKENLKAQGDRLTVEVIDESKYNESGVYQGETKKDPRKQDVKYAKIISIGKYCTEEHQIGNIVVFDPWSGNETPIPNVIVIPEHACLYEVKK